MLIGSIARGIARAAIVRPAIVLTTVGTAGTFGTQFRDLRGELPAGVHTYTTRPVEAVKGVVWHHSATTAKTIRSIAQFHTEVRGWPGIAYHYAIGYDGMVYLLNDPTTISYHAQGYNRYTIGVVLIGNFEEREMTQEMKDAAAKLQDHLHSELDLKFSWLHGDTKATQCPGKHAREYLGPLQYGKRPRR